MANKFSIVVARAQNQGIGYRGDLPWPRLAQDLKFLAKKTTQTDNKDKQNAIIMGRRTWESIPERIRPLKNRYNIVLSSRKSEELPGAHLVCPALSVAMETIQSPPLSDLIESVFILGGASVYEEAMRSPCCEKLYITEVLAEFPADVFFPPVDTTVFRPVA